MNPPIAKRSRWRRIIAAIVIFISSILLLTYTVLATNDGSRWVLLNASHVAPIKMAGIDGNFISGLDIASLSLQSEAANIEIDNLNINIDLWPLLINQQFRIAKLAATRIAVNSHSESRDSSGDQALPTLPALPISVVITGLKIDAIVIDQQIPIAISIEQLSLGEQVLKWRAISLVRDELTMDSSGQWSASSLQQRLTTKTNWSYQDISGSLLGEGPLNQWTLNHSLSLGNDPAKGQVFSHGILAITHLKDIRLAIDNQISGIHFPSGSLASQKLRVESDTKTFSITGDVIINSEHTGEVQGSVSAQGNVAGSANFALSLDTLAGLTAINGEVDWERGVNLTTQVSGKALRLHQFPAWTPALQAIANLDITASMSQDLAGKMFWYVSDAHIQGQLGDAPITLNTRASGSDNNVDVDKLFIQHLGNWLQAKAALKDNLLALTFDADANDLSLYHPSFGGNAKASGQLKISLDNWQKNHQVLLNLSSRQLTFADTQIGGFSVSLANQQSHLTGHLSSDYIHSGDIAVEGFTHTLEGRLQQDRINLNGAASGQMIISGRRFELPTTNSQWQWYKTGPTLVDFMLESEDKRFDLTLEAIINRENQLAAALDVSVLSLQWLRDIEPRLERIDGTASLTSKISGHVASDEPLNIVSQFDISAPLIDVIDPAIRLNDNAIQGELTKDGAFNFTGSARQGDKPISLHGSGKLVGKNAPSLQINVHAEELRASTPKVELAISPTISLAMDSQLMVIRGEVGVPMADIEISKLPNPSFTQSNDVIVVGREAPPATKSIKQDIAITLNIDDKVVIKAAGLATKLRGALQYTSPPNKPAQLQGKLDLVDGSLTSQNGDLSIKRGSLLFTGSTDNPNVDIVAVRQIESPAIEVGLHITGTVKDLRTAIISIPAIDQTRALSYLVFGRDITQDDQGDNNSNAQLMSAAISLGIGQSSSLVQNLKRSIGLDELAAVANDSGTASLVAGKQINNKLYARYRYDMAEALGVLLLRYRLSQRWTLEAESGADNSIDVLYRLGD